MEPISNPEAENKTMNPQIASVYIGIRSLRPMEILPLSMGDLNKIITLVETDLKEYMERNPEGGTEITIGTFIVNTIKNNMTKVLTLVLDAKDDDVDGILNEMTTMQASGIVKIIYEENFFNPFEKNLKSLLAQTLGRLFPQQTQLEPSLEVTEDTELKTSTESDGLKEE